MTSVGVYKSLMKEWELAMNTGSNSANMIQVRREVFKEIVMVVLGWHSRPVRSCLESQYRRVCTI